MKTVSLECQVTELEEELDDVKDQLLKLKQQKDEEINDLNISWQNKLEIETREIISDKKDLTSKITELESQLERSNANLIKGKYSNYIKIK